jgi:hypothetical protein
MNITQAGLNKKIRINGIKLSHELVQVNLLDRSLPQDFRTLFFRLLAQHQINIPFILITGMGEKIQGSCCVAAEDVDHVKKLVAMEPELKENVKFISSVGALSVFPHQSKLRLLGLCLYILGKVRLPLYGMASSISSLTFITDYLQLDSAVSALLKYLDLPPNHAPFRPEIHVIQQKR